MALQNESNQYYRHSIRNIGVIMKQVTVVICAYNSENTIAKCIRSVSNQSYKNLQILVVNDGSTDNTMDVCEELMKRDPRIIVVNQPNSGVSAARNKGLVNTTGDYVTFVDSDDYLENDHIEKLISGIDGNKLAITGYYYDLLDSNGRLIRRTEKKEDISGEYFLNDLANLYSKELLAVVWNKLYITSMINGQNIRFDENIRLGEDFLFNLDYLSCCRVKSFFVCKDTTYHYINQKKERLSSSYNEDFINIQNTIFHKFKSLVSKYDNESLKKMNYLHANALFASIDNLMMIKRKLPKSDFKKIYNSSVRKINDELNNIQGMTDSLKMIEFRRFLLNNNMFALDAMIRNCAKVILGYK